MAVARLGQQARDLGADPARVGPQHEDAVRQDHRLFDVVRHDQHRLRREVVVVPEPQQLGPQVLRGEHVEGGEGLVHEQRVGLDDERAGEADPLTHPARELLGVGRLEPVQADRVDGALGADVALLGLDTERLEPDLDVLLHGQPRQQGETLEDHGDAGVGAVEQLAPVLDLAAGGGDQPRDAAQQRALAGSTAAQRPRRSRPRAASARCRRAPAAGCRRAT